MSAILEDYDFKKMIDTVAEIGYECVEVACWPKAKAERRYAGVSHIDVANLGDKEADVYKRQEYVRGHQGKRKRLV